MLSKVARKKIVVVVCAALVVLDEEFKAEKKRRAQSLFRPRWDPYLVQLAIQENSFISRYRLHPRDFMFLVKVLDPYLKVDQQMQMVSNSRSGSAPIKTDMRIVG